MARDKDDYNVLSSFYVSEHIYCSRRIFEKAEYQEILYLQAIMIEQSSRAFLNVSYYSRA